MARVLVPIDFAAKDVVSPLVHHEGKGQKDDLLQCGGVQVIYIDGNVLDGGLDQAEGLEMSWRAH